MPRAVANVFYLRAASASPRAHTCVSARVCGRTSDAAPPSCCLSHVLVPVSVSVLCPHPSPSPRPSPSMSYLPSLYNPRPPPLSCPVLSCPVLLILQYADVLIYNAFTLSLRGAHAS